jgi:hypothetical protein
VALPVCDLGEDREPTGGLVQIDEVSTRGGGGGGGRSARVKEETKRPLELGDDQDQSKGW